jgi:hypothetical protein
VYNDAVTTSPKTDTAIGQSGYCRPFSQVNTISEQLPIGPELIRPKSAAAACRRLMLTTNPMKMAAAKNRPSALRIDAPKLKSLS